MGNERKLSLQDTASLFYILLVPHSPYLHQAAPSARCNFVFPHVILRVRNRLVGHVACKLND